MTKELITIDAADKTPGRVATEIATYLLGKHRVDYQPNTNSGEPVEVVNVEQMKLDRKYTNRRGYRFSKTYYTHSLYPGGLKTKTASEMTPKEILNTAVFNMLPKNKMRAQLLKRLTIK